MASKAASTNAAAAVVRVSTLVMNLALSSLGKRDNAAAMAPPESVMPRWILSQDPAAGPAREIGSIWTSPAAPVRLWLPGWGERPARRWRGLRGRRGLPV